MGENKGIRKRTKKSKIRASSSRPHLVDRWRDSLAPGDGGAAVALLPGRRVDAAEVVVHVRAGAEGAAQAHDLARARVRLVLRRPARNERKNGRT